MGIASTRNYQLGLTPSQPDDSNNVLISPAAIAVERHRAKQGNQLLDNRWSHWTASARASPPTVDYPRYTPLAVDEEKLLHSFWIEHRSWRQMPPESATQPQIYPGRTFPRWCASVDFSENALIPARLEINGWASRVTGGIFEELLPAGLPTPEIQRVEGSVFGLQASWIAEDLLHVVRREANFYPHASTPMRVPAYRLDGTFRIGTFVEEGLHVIELPLANGKWIMTILLPLNIGAHPQLERRLSANRLKVWLDQLEPRRLQITIPRIAISGERLFQSKNRHELRVHKAQLLIADVPKSYQEETAVRTHRPVDQPRSRDNPIIRVNRPFLFLIRDHATDIVLTAGRVMKPSPSARSHWAWWHTYICFGGPWIISDPDLDKVDHDFILKDYRYQPLPAQGIRAYGGNPTVAGNISSDSPPQPPTPVFESGVYWDGMFVSKCFRKAGQIPALKHNAIVLLALHTDRDGRVLRATMIDSTLGLPSIERCVDREIANMIGFPTSYHYRVHLELPIHVDPIKPTDPYYYSPTVPVSAR